MRSRHEWHIVLSVGLAALGVLLLLTQPGAPHTKAQGPSGAWPLTNDGRSRFAGWSPDGHTVLVNRWGTVVGDDAATTRQTLSELWTVDLRDGTATMISGNAVQPAYTMDGQRLAYLAFAENGRWKVRVLDLASGQEKVWANADWYMDPAWVGERLAFAQQEQVWLSNEGVTVVPAVIPALPTRARVRFTADGSRAAWSDGTRLWVRPHLGKEARLLATEGHVLDFAWSPDGQWLAYVSAAENPSPELWVADVDGNQAPVLLVQGQAETFSTPSWSPDGQTLAFSRTPLGAATASASDIWLTNIDGRELQPLLRNNLEESSPAWSPDGLHMAFNRAGDVWVLDLTMAHAGQQPSRQERLHSPGITPPPEPLAIFARALSPLVQHTPPATIRVIHRAENYYRSDVPVGQIDIIPFETYVKRVVPVEISASFYPIEAIKAQAMAARTYAWHYTEHPPDPAWDVSDWTDYQAMGSESEQHTRSDAATDATEGQYVAHQGTVIKAFYSAENGCPTRGIEGVDYIQAVDDPVSFGQERRGHGWGMSQQGARRWAEWHGWGYQQILTHYYTDVTIELPSTGGPTPIGGVTLPWSDFFITSNQVYVVANGSDEASAVSAVGFYAMTDTTTLIVTDTVGDDGWSTVWDVTALSDTASTGITLSLLVADGNGNVQSQAETAHIGLDRRPPTNTTAVIHGTYTDTITITLSSLSAADPDPGSGVQMMAFSNDGWIWEGEGLYHEDGSGEQVDDKDALNGKAWRGLAGTHSAGAWYGPYTGDLSPNRAYRAYFRLKTNDVITTAEVAMLDVVDNGGTRVLGLRRLRGTDFRASDTYQEFPVDFDYTDAGTLGLEFRTAFRSTADLYLDRVIIVGYPTNVATSAQWRLAPGEGLKTVIVKFIDGAGNVSTDLTRTVTLSDTHPPTGWGNFAWWREGDTITAAACVFDEISGLNVDSALYRFSTDGAVSWSDWGPATCTGISGTNEIQTATVSGLPLGQPKEMANHVEFQIADMKGYTSTAIYTVPIRLYLPLVMRH
ncbi:MAG: SpoIID/LytB domain-containing protein [Chloroflexota bacterium]|nr:SpoIID/LytB domain-containing protein [Chloroflexota bacterium]